MRPVTPIDYGAELAGLNRGLLTTADTLVGNPLAGLLNTAMSSDIQRGPILRYAQNLGVGQGSGGLGQLVGEMGSEMMPIAGDIAGAKKDWDAWNAGNLPGWAVPLAIAGLLPLVPPAARYLGRALPDMAGTPAAFGRDQRGMVGGANASPSAAVQDYLPYAKDMDASGYSREEILDATGWFKGGDDKWRFEIDDSMASINTNATYGDRQTRVRDLMSHPELARHYPELADTPVDFRSMGGKSGSYILPDGDVGRIRLSDSLSPDETKSTLLHELQHAVQNKEGFSPGGNIDQFAVPASQVSASRVVMDDTMLGADVVDDLRAAGITNVDDPGFYDAFKRSVDRLGVSEDAATNGLFAQLRGGKDIPDVDAARAAASEAATQYQDLTVESVLRDKARASYMALPGEVEARTVQGRAGLLSDERKQRPFWMDYDTP